MKIEDIEVYDEDRNEFGETPLMKACANGDYDEVLDMLLKDQNNQMLATF